MNAPITLRPAAAADGAACAQVLFDAFGGIARAHNFPLDFPKRELTDGMAHMLVSHPRLFGVVAEAEGKVVGCNFLDQRDAIAGVGPIAVDPGLQCRGVGRRLMQAVIDRGRAERHPGIRLVQDAFNTTSMSLYASLGFDVREPLALVTGRPTGDASQGEVRPVTPDDVPECAELCRAVHGFDRANELRDAIERFQPMLLCKQGNVVAYTSAPHFWFLNHGVARSEAEMFDLLLGIAAAHEQPLALLLPTRQSSFHRWCLSHGLRMVKPMSLMTMGEYYEPKGCYFTSVAY